MWRASAARVLSVIRILHQVQGEHFIARLAAMIFLLQIARARKIKKSSLYRMVRSQLTRHTTLVDCRRPGFHTLFESLDHF